LESRRNADVPMAAIPVVLALVGFVQGTSLCIFLLARRRHTLAWNASLLVALALLSLRQLAFAAAYEDWFAARSFAAMAGTASIFLVWPCFVAYACGSRSVGRSQGWFHALLAACVAAAVLVHAARPGSWFPFPHDESVQLVAGVAGALTMAAGAGAAVASAWRLRASGVPARKRRAWLRSLSTLAAVVPAAALCAVIFPAAGTALRLAELGAETVLIEFVALVAMANGRILCIPPPRSRDRTGLPTPTERVTERLLLLMDAREPYRNPNLRVTDLAQALGVPAHVLSAVINRELGTSFFDFVNGYRIRDAGRLLRDPERQQYTILSIALEVGFASKTAFNRAFKRHMGVTPSRYQRHGPDLRALP
jgi:AraC-like DNA-binding protein